MCGPVRRRTSEGRAKRRPAWECLGRSPDQFPFEGAPGADGAFSSAGGPDFGHLHVRYAARTEFAPGHRNAPDAFRPLFGVEAEEYADHPGTTRTCAHFDTGG